MQRTGVSFNPYCSGCTAGSNGTADDGVREIGFNPYCSGCTAGRRLNFSSITKKLLVSILIVVDVPLEV